MFDELEFDYTIANDITITSNLRETEEFDSDHLKSSIEGVLNTPTFTTLYGRDYDPMFI